MKGKNKISFVAFSCILCLCSCGEGEEQIFFAPQAAEATYMQEELANVSAEIPELIMVHVCGAVNEPGVVALEQGSRAVDAIASAGGMTAQADAAYINLAAVVQDGEQLYVPTYEETFLWEAAEAKANLININTATLEQLCTLPGIGESKAADIIAYREKYGAFGDKADIMEVSGIKESLYTKIEALIIVE